MENTSLITYSCSFITDDQRGFPPFVYKLFFAWCKGKGGAAGMEVGGTLQPETGWAIVLHNWMPSKGDSGTHVEPGKHHSIVPVMLE